MIYDQEYLKTIHYLQIRCARLNLDSQPLCSFYLWFCVPWFLVFVFYDLAFTIFRELFLCSCAFQGIGVLLRWFLSDFFFKGNMHILTDFWHFSLVWMYFLVVLLYLSGSLGSLSVVYLHFGIF